jgi:preprotein translocase subunit SecD
MIRNLTNRIIVIVVALGLAIWIDLSDRIRIVNPIDDSILFQANVTPKLGLDLQGGLQVLLEADLPADAEISAEMLDTARDIIEQRTNALALSENLIQVAGERRIVGEFPGLEDSEAVLDIIQQTGLLEFVDTGDLSLEEGAVMKPTGPADVPKPTERWGATPETTVYNTIMTGRDLSPLVLALIPSAGTRSTSRCRAKAPRSSATTPRPT